MVFRFPGVLEEDPPEAARLWALGCRGLQQQGDEIAAWFDGRLDLPVEGAWSEEPDVDWLEAYYASLEPVVVPPLVVAGTHRAVTVEPGLHVLWLDPGMAFGTGHHATTRMALEQLASRDLTGLRVLDVGSGSGILAIAADRLGAASSLGVDTDPATVPIAREVARRNHARATFEVGSVDGRDPRHACDVLVANLYAEAHVALASVYARIVAVHGFVIVTGILVEREANVQTALEAAGLRVTHRRVDGGWVLLEAQNA